DTNGSTTTKVYYAFAGQTVAMRAGLPGTPLEYFLTDQLGSVILALDASGNPIAGTQQRYMPFGQPRFNNTPVTDFAYTGQRDLDLQGNSFSLGLMDYNARFYDDYITHFNQPDTIIPDQYNPQTLNKYAYAQDNPINFNDPSGHCIEDLCIGEIILAAVVIEMALPGIEDFVSSEAPQIADVTSATVDAAQPVLDQAVTDGGQALEDVSTEIAGASQQLDQEISNVSTAIDDVGSDLSTGDTSDLVYRVMRPDEDPDSLENGIVAKDPMADYNPQYHVTHGNVVDTNWISTTRSLQWALDHQSSDTPIYVINLDDVPTQIVDTTVPHVMDGWHPIAQALASRASEVLINTYIPYNAIQGVIPATPE
ncbi:MAG: RHS repeat-associated core domain-containing protein, partial [Anaerolineales bacterium]